MDFCVLVKENKLAVAGKIPENILDDILSRIDIVELISGYIPLKRAGRNFRALCPFHHEKTPSFMVSSDRQIYHCFGCSKGGNAFGFLMEYERLGFLEAVQTLAKKAGVILPELKKDDDKAASLSAQLYKINELALDFYENNLKNPAAASIKNYLSKRQIKDSSVQLARLGYAPETWDALLQYLRNKGVSISFVEKAGLLVSREGGGYYDRFRKRVIFPIFDIKSRVIGFGARFVPGPEQGSVQQPQAKYINSPETPVYIKGRNLYGLHLAKDAIRENDSAVIVEGYLDFIIPFQEGLHNLVASLGTALTCEQARLLKRYTHNVVMVYDADDAGELATLRSLDIFVDEGMNVRVVSLPQGFDPDLFVRKHGIGAFRDKLEQARTLFDYKLQILKSRHSAKEAEGKARIASEMLSTISRFTNAVVKSEYIKKLAQELDVKEDSLFEEIRKIKEPKTYAGAPQAKPAGIAAMNSTEKLLIKLMLEEKECIEHLRGLLEPADFQDGRIARIVSVLFDLAAQGKEIGPHKLLNHLDADETLGFICESALLPQVPEEDRERIMHDCVARLKKEKLRLRRHHLHEKIKDAQHSGDEETLKSLVQEFHDLIKIKV